MELKEVDIIPRHDSVSGGLDQIIKYLGKEMGEKFERDKLLHTYEIFYEVLSISSATGLMSPVKNITL